MYIYKYIYIHIYIYIYIYTHMVGDFLSGSCSYSSDLWDGKLDLMLDEVLLYSGFEFVVARACHLPTFEFRLFLTLICSPLLWQL